MLSVLTSRPVRLVSVSASFSLLSLLSAPGTGLRQQQSCMEILKTECARGNHQPKLEASTLRKIFQILSPLDLQSLKPSN